MQPLVLLVVGLLIVFLLVAWVIAFVRKVGGCLIHLMLVAAALLLFVYLGWFFWQRFLQG